MAEQDLGKIGLTPRGAWSVTETTYERLDLVSYIDGCSYVVVNPSVGYLAVGILPTNTLYYQINAKKGDIGSSSGVAYPTVAVTNPYAGQVYMVDTASYGATFTTWGTIGNTGNTTGNTIVNVVPVKVGELYVSNARLVRNAGNTAWVLGFESVANGAPDLSGYVPRSEFAQLTISKNLFNSSNVITGEYIDHQNDGGAFVTATKAAHTNYIAIEPNVSYIFTGVGAGGHVFNIYDSSKVLISNTRGASIALPFYTPINAAFIIFNTWVLSTTQPNYALIQLEKGTVQTTVVPYSDQKVNRKKLDGKITFDIIEDTVLGKNLFNPLNIVNGYYIAPSGIITARADSARTGTIPVTENTTYTISGLYTSYGNVVNFYNSSNVLISTVAGIDNLTFTTPALTSYIYFSIKPAIAALPDYTLIQLELGARKTLFESYGYLLKSSRIKFEGDDITNNLVGKSIGFMGDSISTPDSAVGLPNTDQIYHGLIASRYGAIRYYDGRNGTKISPRSDVNNFSNPTRFQIFGANNLDALVIFAGTNDFGVTTLGTKADSESLDTFYGTLKYFMHSVLDYYKTTKIFYMTPLHRNRSGTEVFPLANAQGALFTDFIDAIKYCAGIYGITVIDTNQNSGLNYWNMTPNSGSGYSTDGLHPLAVGHAKIAAFVGPILNNHFR